MLSFEFWSSLIGQLCNLGFLYSNKIFNSKTYLDDAMPLSTSQTSISVLSSLSNALMRTNDVFKQKGKKT